MNALRIALGLASPIVVPLLTIWVQEQWAPIDTSNGTLVQFVVAGVFLLTGCLTGWLIGAWWSLAYLLGLGILYTVITLLQEEYPGSEGHAIAVALAIVITPIVMLGAAIGVLLSKRFDQGLPSSPAH